MKKSKKVERRALFVRIKKTHKEFIEKETEATWIGSGKFTTNQDTVDKIVAGYRRLKKDNPNLVATMF